MSGIELNRPLAIFSFYKSADVHGIPADSTHPGFFASSSLLWTPETALKLTEIMMTITLVSSFMFFPKSNPTALGSFKKETLNSG